MSYRYFSVIFSAVLALGVAGAALTPASLAQDEKSGEKTSGAEAASDDANPDKVVARVDGKPITASQLKLARDELSRDISSLPEEAQRQLVLQWVIELNLLAKAAREAGLDETKDYKELARYYELRALRDVFFQREIWDSITDEEAKKLYDERIGGAEPKQEIRARHILVKTEDEAKAIIAQLADGADFAKLAKEKSTGPSGKNGGDLGFFSKEQMVTPFAEAAFELDKGEVSEPVKTRFGWHVIKVEDRRKGETPSFEEAERELRTEIVETTIRDLIADLRSGAEIEIKEPPKASPAAAGAEGAEASGDAAEQESPEEDGQSE